MFVLQPGPVPVGLGVWRHSLVQQDVVFSFKVHSLDDPEDARVVAEHVEPEGDAGPDGGLEVGSAEQAGGLTAHVLLGEVKVGVAGAVIR